MEHTAFPPIKGFMSKSSQDWPGQQCGVLLLPYCNLRCPYCNQRALILEPDRLETLSLDLILSQMVEQSQGVDRICLSGGEPTIHRTLAPMLRKIRQSGFKTAVATNGTQPDIVGYLIDENLLDHVIMDVKAPLNDSAYDRCAGVYVPTSLIKETLAGIMASGISYTFVCTLVPSLLSDDDISQMARELYEQWRQTESAGDTPPRLILRPFMPEKAMDPTLQAAPPTEEKVLARMQKTVDNILT